MKQIAFDDFIMGGGLPLVLIAGPCVIEDEAKTIAVARTLKGLTEELDVPLIFKASYDKANRTSLNSYRGPGVKEGLRILQRVKEEFGIPVISDVHRFEEIEEASSVLDVVQVPAFLCRQTDFIMEVARHAGIVNIKKGQFLAPWDVSHIVKKVISAGNENVMITERGFSFGYNNLVSDMRSLPMLRKTGYPVVFDATHSVQLPGGQGSASGGEREMALCLARAAVAVGIDGLFLEVHPDPECALCDGPNSLYLNAVSGLLATLKEIDHIVKKDSI